MTTEDPNIEKIAGLVDDFPIAMLATVADGDRILAQPYAMQQQHHRFDGELWFLISADSSTAQRITANPALLVSLSANDSWVSLSGLGELSNEQHYIDAMWDSSVEAWFPGGQQDPNIRALIFHADTAEYWDTPGSKVATAVSYLKSKVTGTPISIDSDKVDL